LSGAHFYLNIDEIDRTKCFCRGADLSRPRLSGV
jgi:hypothetical protein